MNCKTCNVAHAQFELVGGECIRCVAADRDRLWAVGKQLVCALSECKHAWADYLHNPDAIGWAIEELVRDAESALHVAHAAGLADTADPVDKPPADELVCQPAATATTTQA
jgi:hypothetical protein